MSIFGGEIGYRFHGYTADLDSSFQGINLRLTGLGLVASNISSAFTSMFTAPLGASVEFSQTIATASAVTAGFGNDSTLLRDELSKLAVELGVKSVFSAQEAAEALVGLGRRGVDTASAGVRGLLPILDLAAATNADLAASGNLVASALNAFGQQFTEAEHFADVFTGTVNNSAVMTEDFAKVIQYVGSTANSSNIPIEVLSATVGVLANSGITATVASTGLRRVINELENPSIKLENRLNALGLSEDDVSIKANGLTNVIRTLKEAGFDPTSESIEQFGERGGNVFQILGGEAFNLNRELVSTTDAIDEFGGMLATTEGLARGTAEAMQSTLGFQLDVLHDRWNALLITIGQSTEGIWKTFIQFLNDSVLPSLTSLIETFPLLGGVIQVVGGTVGLLLSVFGRVTIALGLMGVAFPAASGAISAYTTSVVAGFSATNLLITSLSLLTQAVAVIAVAWLAWKFGTWLSELEVVKTTVQSVMSLFFEWGNEIESTRVRMETEYSSMSKAFSDYAAGMDVVRQAILDGDTKLAADRLEIANQDRTRQIQERIDQLQAEADQYENRKTFQEHGLDALNESEKAHYLRLFDRIKEHNDAIRNLDDQAYKDKQLLWEKQHIEEEKAQAEKNKAVISGLEEEQSAIEKANVIFKGAIDAKSDFWKKYVDNFGDVLVGDYKFHLDDLTESERVSLAKLLNEEEISLERVHGLWTSFNNRIDAQFEKHAAAQAAYYEKLNKANYKYQKDLARYVDDVVGEYVRYRESQDSQFKILNDLRQTALKLQEQWLVAMRYGWSDMAAYAEKEFGRVTQAIRDNLNAQSQAMTAAEDDLNRHIKYVSTLTANSNLQYKLLAAAAQETLMDEVVGKIFLPFKFEAEELSETWDSLTKEQKERITKYYEDTARGVGGSVKDIQDILDGLNKSNTAASEDLTMSVEDLEKRIASLQDKLAKLKGSVVELEDATDDLKDADLSSAADGLKDASDGISAAKDKISNSAYAMSGAFVAASASISNTLGYLKANAREDMEELAEIMAGSGIEAGFNLSTFFSGTGFQKFLKELAGGATSLANPEGFLGDMNRILGSLAGKGGFELPDSVKDILGEDSSSSQSNLPSPDNDLSYLPTISVDIRGLSDMSERYFDTNLELSRERNSILIDHYNLIRDWIGNFEDRAVKQIVDGVSSRGGLKVAVVNWPESDTFRS